MAINLSGWCNDDFPNPFHTVLLETGLAPARLQFETTEGVTVTSALGILRRLKKFGVHAVMVDFGIGYSLQSCLWSFPFDKIKIDQAFIACLNHSEQLAAIIRAAESCDSTDRQLCRNVRPRAVRDEESAAYDRKPMRNKDTA